MKNPCLPLETPRKTSCSTSATQEHGTIAASLAVWGRLPSLQLLLRLRKQSLLSQSRQETRTARQLIAYQLRSRALTQSGHSYYYYMHLYRC